MVVPPRDQDCQGQLCAECCSLLHALQDTRHSVKHTRTPPPVKLEKDDQLAIIAWCLNRHPKLRPQLLDLWDDCRDYYLMQGDRGEQLNWPACFRRWVRRTAKGPPKREALPQEYRPPGKAQLRLVRNIINDKKEQEQ